MSHLIRVRGLKLLVLDNIDLNQLVAPHTGAWIETGNPKEFVPVAVAVAPHTGAWIETLPRAFKQSSTCRTSYGCVD